jgi:alpha-mannosidase
MEGAAGERYGTICSDIHPRGIENWIGASNPEFGVTMSSSVAVADWIDPTDHPADYPVLQPILIASRHSCHWEGNPYLQAGDHHFNFAVTSHQPGWSHALNFGRQANETLQTVWADNKFANASLPEQLSFFSTGDPNVLISTIKKAEDSDEVILRLVDLEGKNKKLQFHSFQKIKEAWLTNLIEEEVKKLKITHGKPEIEVGKNSIETLKLN